MKRLISVLLILTMLFSLCACSESGIASDHQKDYNDTLVLEETPEETPEEASEAEEPVVPEDGDTEYYENYEDFLGDYSDAGIDEDSVEPDIELEDVAPEDSPLQDWEAIEAQIQQAIASGDMSGLRITLDEGGTFTSKDDVSLYIQTYNHLPDNFITKKEAQELGWPGGDLSEYAPGKCIGGDRFGNYEGLLPKKKGRTYYECDIDTLGAKSRGAKRIIYSNDGLIYYTEDHYESFELLYGEP